MGQPVSDRHTLSLTLALLSIPQQRHKETPLSSFINYAMTTSGQLYPASSKAVPVRTLVTVFVLWKLLLLCVASASPGIGYDTSTRLLLPSMDGSVPVTVLQHVSSRLVRWDALYFLRIAERGCLFEQEWAFNSSFTRLVAFVARGAPP